MTHQSLENLLIINGECRTDESHRQGWQYVTSTMESVINAESCHSEHLLWTGALMTHVLLLEGS